MAKKRILIVADDYNLPSGFGTVMNNLLKGIENTNLDITYLIKATSQQLLHNMKNRYNFKHIFNSNYDHIAFDTLHTILREEPKFDLIFIYEDLDIVLMHYYGSSLYNFSGNDLLYDQNVIAYSPIDTLKIPEIWKKGTEIEHLKILAITKVGESILKDAGFKTIGYLPHASNKEIYKLDLSKKVEDKDGVLYVGRLDKRKNIFALLDIAKKLSEDNIHVTIKTFIDRQNIDVVKQSGILQSNINVILDYLSEEGLAALYRAHKFYVSVTHAEGFGLPFLDSIMCGTPVITVDNNIIKEVVGPNGIYIPTYSIYDDYRIWSIIKNENEAINIIKESLKMDKESYLDLRTKQYEHANKYSWEDNRKKFIDILEAE